MMVNRRTFLKGLAAGAAALVLPPTLADNAEAAKRVWALDSTMVGPRSTDPGGVLWWVEQAYNPEINTHIATATEFDSIYVSDSSSIRRGDLLSITEPPSDHTDIFVPEMFRVDSVHRDRIFVSRFKARSA